MFKKFHAPNDKEGRSLSELLEYAFLGSLCTLLRYGWRIISLFTSKTCMWLLWLMDGVLEPGLESPAFWTA